jgi:hypothetical protein
MDSTISINGNIADPYFRTSGLQDFRTSGETSNISVLGRNERSINIIEAFVVGCQGND